ncbi:hypothetical protein [Bacillus pumilus]|uniref:Uncharacterized protein n=1 Tax=Bacillus pumilus TaxID=1408 RepID=A0AAD0ML81_BACPU|nr:hypothetical protein [Bacillus pumilus]AVM24209.1 hypothetical protein C5695_10295 [Bacillus pumilus]TYS39870.1 hypothetical protein FZC68_18395 [Bacillus pumilus]
MDELEWWGIELNMKDESSNVLLIKLFRTIKQTFENLYKVKRSTFDSAIEDLESAIPEYEKRIVPFLQSELISLRKEIKNIGICDREFILRLEYALYIYEPEIDCVYPESSRDTIITFFNMINEEIKRLSMLNNMYLIAEKNTKRDVNGFTVIEASDDWRD